MSKVGALSVFVAAALVTALELRSSEASLITVDYPEQDSIFPPEITPPTFLWRDSAGSSTLWQIEISFSDGGGPIRVDSRGERLQVGEIDPRTVAATNELPKLTPELAAAHSWKPDGETWEVIKRRSTQRPATMKIAGYLEGKALSRGEVTFKTSKDPVGAPIFYRDVPLMPSELEKGVIKPLPASAVRLIAWRLRNVADTKSRVLVEGLYTCANCHSFSRDGKTFGMDLDGPQNDKGMYAIADVKPQMTIRNEDVISWDAARDRPASPMRVGFMSQVSPDGQYVVTTLNPAREHLQDSYYVANFKDYRFLQVFYPTRGILAWYNRSTRQIQPLPGADDPQFVQTDGVWSPDGKYLVFARARATDPYPAGRPMALRANDPNEIPLQYDLYRIPFNEGRGGAPEPIRGASANGMSNTFPKVSPDGRWIVYVQCRNGQLMRPDGQLYIVPAEGGAPRKMRCNTRLMNSWHSFSPNGRWMVFSSKVRSPYTQMYLTHIDEDGHDSPAILIDNSTASNRAVNIPEFVNIPPDGLLKIDIPAVEFYRVFDRAWELTQKGQDDAAITEWKNALSMSPNDDKSHSNLGAVLLRQGRFDEAVTHFQRALAIKSDSAGGYNNLGVVLLQKGRLREAAQYFDKALALNPAFAEARFNMASVYYLSGRIPQALEHWRKGLAIEPRPSVMTQVAWVLSTSPEASVRNGKEAIGLAERALQLSTEKAPETLDTLAAAYAEAGRFRDAIETVGKAQALAAQQHKSELADAIKGRAALYAANSPFREEQRR